MYANTQRNISADNCLNKLLAQMREDYIQVENELEGYLTTLPICGDRKLNLTLNPGLDNMYIHTVAMDFSPWHKSFTISVTSLVKLMSMQEEIEQALFDVLQPGPKTPFDRDLGGNVFLNINDSAPTMGLRQYIEIAGKLVPTWACIDMYPDEWLFLTITYNRLCQSMPLLHKMRSCVNNHTESNSRLSCCN